MNDIDTMQQNLARMLNEHFSQGQLDTTEPADPFQKRTFGKKMRKSAVSIIHEHEQRPISLPKIDPAALRSCQQLQEMRPGEPQEDCDQQAEMYMREVEVLMARLRVGLEKIEENCREKVHRICATTNGRQRQQKAQGLLSQIETSIDFITHDCFAFQGKNTKDKENRQDKDNRDVRELKECKQMKEVKESREGRKSSIVGSRTRPNERHQKSIYESVLEERKLRRSKKRII